MSSLRRADLSNHSILLLLLGLLILVVMLMLSPQRQPPASNLGQAAGIAGSLLLLGPLLFSIVKRGESALSPPLWFVIHVLSAWAGCFFIAIHVAAGNWLSPPGLVLLFLVLLILQGSFMRTVGTRGYSQLFARNTKDGGFSVGNRPDRDRIRALIDKKTRLLDRLDPAAQEGLFSPALRHWVRHPYLSLQYQLLAEEESMLVGGRISAPFVLRWARRWHLLIATLFFIGLLVHVITVLFFAGYVADGGDITWWHITAWGAPG